MTDKKKAMTGAERTAKNYRLNQARGLRHVKVWAHPDDIKALQDFAKTLPKTKAILNSVSS